MKHNDCGVRFVACLLGVASVFSGCSCSQEQANEASVARDNSPSAKTEEERQDQQPKLTDQDADLPDASVSGASDGADVKAKQEQPHSETPPAASASGGREKKRELPAWLTGEQRATSRGSNPQTGAGGAGASDKESRATSAAVQKARTHLAASRKAGKRNSQKAFREAVAGWQLVAPHAAHDEQSRALTATLEKELRLHGEAANRGADAPDRFKALAVE